MAEYHFVTLWQFAAPIESVWNAITQTQDWPTWWQAVQSVEELEAGDPTGIGHISRFVWKMPLGYTLAFNTQLVRLEAPMLMEAIAKGDVEGRGLWELSPIPEGCQVRYSWTVRTSGRWMNWAARLARPILEWNHNAVMNQGGRALADHLGIQLIATKSSVGGSPAKQ
ncbi:SRPBCC family protein [Leptolyngbya sp. O-77]|uniref:SRPBCC family protein n=1 Tax=Leptolyngbya sp. O-77 TaxID=1080068 RepID=UPI00074D2A5E|nr:SRPBCC family protein [Leptolyngbya sp. O-77]BAU41577.1 Polyketide cyclase / dehydrase and lipid transport [Leptolyngbya sp. O-77]